MTTAVLLLEPLPGHSGLPQGVPDRYALSEQQDNRLGRNPDCAVFLDYEPFQMVSRYHASIQAFPAVRGRPQRVWQLRDLGSANGTYINGQPLEESHWLQTGDRIQLGSTGPCFRFSLLSQDSRRDRSELSQAEFAPIELPQAELSQAELSQAELSQAELAQIELSPFDRPQADRSQGDRSQFDRPQAQAPAQPAIAENLSPSPPSPLTLSQLFPLASPGSNFAQRALLVPGILTVALAVSLFAAFGHPLTFNRILALYLSVAGYYFFIYRLCGKPKPWWVLGLAAIAMAVILQSPLASVGLWLFREILPGSLPDLGQGLGPLEQFGRLFIGTGLLEEGLKAIPVLLCWAIGRQLPSPWRDRVGLREPLDGILLGAAAGVGFTLVETLGQYVPQVTAQISEVNGLEAGQLAGLQLLIPRLLGSISGHMAYSGYLGYFLGLSILQPRQRWPILLVGYLSAAFLHTLWNWAGLASAVLLTIAGLLSYFVLMGAILKARALSPTRAQNFATNLYYPPPSDSRSKP
ncbi:MAG: PrsW family glutamic-type intramembrane protease [Prochlorothrix sp.]|nr:PrsW family glutamic-type intramembrane protease [Prochlorothrix sp.]